ncbi:MAG: CBS domain-containing protein [Proteobacteria bacterium]|jgi:magnesium and cobalt transporter|nr:CBS domain-containing protein [Pseudomonadota bacterium]
MMSDGDSQESKTWLEKLSSVLTGEPTSREALIAVLRSAQEREVLDFDTLSIIEGALVVSDMQVREIMVPRSKVVFVRLDMNPQEFLPLIIDSGHSRFPVVDDNPDKVVGVLLAKDLLPLALDTKRARFSMRDILRSCTAIPESKRVDVLLQEFREKRNHMAVVFDEYGGVSGIVTIEDVLEQIVGDIEDEFDFDEDDFIKQRADGSYSVKALTPIADFNEHFGCDLSASDVDTIGGMVTGEFGHLPSRDECVSVGAFHFKVLNADSRRIHLLELTVSPEM